MVGKTVRMMQQLKRHHPTPSFPMSQKKIVLLIVTAAMPG